jgi:trypsin-like peptidase/tetratricopeptide repeat protein
MSWSDIPDIYKELGAALSAYDWTRAASVTSKLIGRINEEPAPCPEANAKAIIGALRKQRRFELLVPVAEALIRSGQSHVRIRRSYAQALIDQGILIAPEYVLQTLTQDPNQDEVAEAHGLLGRVYKQLYVNADRPNSVLVRSYFDRALGEYLDTYRLNPRKHTWHGINVVALLKRATVDGLALAGAPDPDALARDIIDAVAASEDAWDLATRMEALIALGKYTEAESVALDYSQHPEADTFEFGSTLRQMVEVWRFTDDAPPGSTILPILRAAKLRGERGIIEHTPQAVEREIQAVKAARISLENNFGDDKIVTLRWYETGLLRTKSVARIERLNGSGHGTGWLVSSTDFFPNRPPALLLLTNAHVVNATGTAGALTPDRTHANFQGLDAMSGIGDEIVWSSPPDQLDATLLTLSNEPPKAQPMPLWPKKLRLNEPAQRVYIVGHPAGRDLSLSLHDNKLLGCSDRILHYRTPTEGGSSGSPVFEEEDWRVIGLHHATGRYERLDGKQPPYDANEGIAIVALQAETRKAN